MKRLLILLTFLLEVVALKATTFEVPLLQNVYGREHQMLNGKWSYIIDPQEMGYYNPSHNPIPWGFFNNRKEKKPSDLIEYNFDKAEKMDIPSDWNTQDERLFFYEGNIWFCRYFQYQHKPGKHAILYFGAVNDESIVFVNGRQVGTHVGGFTPFNYDVTDLLKDGKNFVIVKVDNKRHKDHVPARSFDWWNYGGITRDVMLVEVNDTYIEDYRLQLQKGHTNIIDFQVKLNKSKANEKINVSIPELRIQKTVTTDINGCAFIKIKAHPKLWSPESPKLYKIKINHNDEIVDDEIGFRTIETQGKKIILNGKQIFLRGVSMQEEAPFRQGRIRNAEEAHTLLTWAKELGCNFVRLAHYPYNELFIREAERMGIMVWEEIPCYWVISWNNPKTYENAQDQLGTMIKRDKNRANIIIWSVANETPQCKGRNQFLKKLITYARTQDSTRLISLAMEVLSAKNEVNELHDDLHDLVDVVSFNEYIGWYRDLKDAPKMKWVIPYNKPVIVSEFGGGALAGYHGSKEKRWTEEYQAELYRQNLAMLDKIDGLSGLTPWCLVDFRSPRRPLADIQDFFNRKGLISEKGEKKEAFYIVQQFYKKKKNQY